eukprot:Nitzschia sp. Nitz4//scaffold1_size375055//317592//318887//NITZ4_000328-RA/size375055-processed-gene-0.465-mRNA-1//-1//CDS//3329541201//4436//frame0
MAQFHDRNAFGYPSAQHESLWQPSSNTRSAPIAIVRPPGERPIEPMAYDSDDDVDSVIDVVERDARRLRRKFGYNNTSSSATSVRAAATTDASSSPPPAIGVADTGASQRAAQQAPRAPYLGSLNNAEFVMSLPPISLSGDMRGLGEPPEVVSYGSLRESHQQRRFLDGPSSYREPSSGRIRQLEHRTRFQNNDATPPQMSIGERIQQARSQKQAKENSTESGVASSLSVLMDEASKTPEFKPTDPVKVMPLIHHVPYRSTFGESSIQQECDSPSMLSTSLTAFEVLRSSTGGTLTGHQQNHTQRFEHQQQQLQQKEVISIASESQDSHFKPLSRSMSDPTPHVLQRPLPGHTLQQVQSPVTTSSNDPRWVPPFSLGNSSGRPASNVPRPTTTTTTTTMLGPMYTYAVAPSPSSVVPPPEPEATFDMDMDE